MQPLFHHRHGKYLLMMMAADYPLIGIVVLRFPAYLCKREKERPTPFEKCSDGYLPWQTTGHPPHPMGHGLPFDRRIATGELHFFRFTAP